MNTDKPCFGQPALATGEGCARCDGYVSQACAEEAEAKKLRELAESAACQISFPDAYARIQEVTGCRTQVELCQRLAIRQSSISDAKRRASIPAGWLIALLRLYAVSPDWILTGTGGRYLVATDEAPVAVPLAM